MTLARRMFNAQAKETAVFRPETNNFTRIVKEKNKNERRD